MSPRILKLLAISYAVKTILVGAAWLAVPDLPDRTLRATRQAWASLTGTSVPMETGAKR
jgi:hypothetical protein